MNRRIVIALSAAALLLGSAVTLAQDDRTDSEVATEHKSEATQLRGKAESHRKLARLYRSRTPVKGAANFENVAKHCDKLAQYYEDAAREAEAVASELSK